MTGCAMEDAKELDMNELLELLQRHEAAGGEFIIRIEPGGEEADAGRGIL